VPKGSIALNGVSLTINDVFDDGFRVTIIPISLKDTLFESYIVGTFINVEIDMFAKYIYNFLKKDKNKNISWGDIDKTMALY
jgi:riboflavin synthase